MNRTETKIIENSLASIQGYFSTIKSFSLGEKAISLNFLNGES